MNVLLTQRRLAAKLHSIVANEKIPIHVDRLKGAGPDLDIVRTTIACELAWNFVVVAFGKRSEATVRNVHELISLGLIVPPGDRLIEGLLSGNVIVSSGKPFVVYMSCGAKDAAAVDSLIRPLWAIYNRIAAVSADGTNLSVDLLPTLYSSDLRLATILRTQHDLVGRLKAL